MAKKTTRQRKELAQQRAIQQAAANVSLTGVRPSMPTAAPLISSSNQALLERQEEHQRARADLRRIAMLAIGITAVLIALSFVIH
ncbi:MAG TPA: hypothetical protein VJG32_10500 [Anaerolineae bacterium]|nr:hypothetical protein [Anaerolineae bacterium]